MSGDIEDFLRRAAERRQARQANRPAQPAAPARPEYSDARRERTPQARADDDDLVVAEVVEEPLSRKLSELRQAQATAQAMRDAAAPTIPLAQRSGIAERAAARAQAQRSPGLAPIRATPAASVTTAAALPSVQSVAMFELHEALKTPNGLRNAMLLHEILARPEHRW